MKQLKKAFSILLCAGLIIIQLFLPTIGYAAGSNANLSGIFIDGTSINGFSPNITEYTVDVEFSCESISISAAVEDIDASLSGDIGSHTLSVGLNSFIIVVTSEDATAQKEYTINVSREEESQETPTPSPEPTATPTEEPTPTPAASESSTPKPTVEATASPTPSPEPTASSEITDTPEPSLPSSPVPKAGIVTTTDGIVFDTDTGTITDYVGSSSSIIIPTAIDGVDVTEIAGEAFAGNSFITDVEIPACVLLIGFNAFAGCSSELIIYGEIRTTAESHAAESGITFIDRSVVVTANGIRFDTDTGLIYRYEGTEIEVTIPETIEGVEVKIIADSAFANCDSIEAIILPDTITEIEAGGLSLCHNLVSIIFPNGLESVPPSCFSKCTSLQNIYLPESITSIGTMAFIDCSSLKRIFIYPGVTTIEVGAFTRCPLVTIYGEVGSYAETYANNSSIPFMDITIGYDSSLSDLSIDGVTVSGFAQDITSYSITVANTTEQISVAATANDAAAATSGDTGTFSLSVGNNTFSITCTAENGVDSTAYTLTVIRDEPPSADASLSDFTIDGTTVNGFNSETYSYDITLSNSTESITLGAVATDADAVISGDIGTQSLAVGVNTFTVTCTAEDGVTTKDYTVNITRDAQVTEGIVFDAATGTITDYVGTATEVVIPEFIEGVAVTAIGDEAFEHSDITQVIIGNSVTYIGADSFRRCENLTEVQIGISVSAIDTSSFSDCESLQNINVLESNQYFSSVDGILFDKTKELLIKYPNDNPRTSYTIPDSVITINKYAFYSSNNITSLSIGANVTTIEYSAFAECLSLNDISMGSNVSTVGNYAFQYCAVESLSFSDELLTIGDYTFNGCSELLSVDLGSKVTSIGTRAFSSCEKLNVIDLGESLVSISSYAFFDCSSLSSISFPDTLEIIDYSAFSGCINLDVDLVLPDKVRILGSGAFARCLKIRSVFIGNNVTGINSQVFADCIGIENVTIGINVTKIEISAFRGCAGLAYITIPTNVLKIDHNAFAYCTNLVSITIPDNVITLGSNIFESCVSLSDVVIGDGISNIPELTFYNCTSLENVEFGTKVNTISREAFRNCTSLVNLSLPKNLSKIEELAFKGCTALSAITWSNSITSIGGSAFSECASLTSVSLPESVTEIDTYAFQSCSQLTSMTILFNAVTFGMGIFENCHEDLVIYGYTGTEAETYANNNGIPFVGNSLNYDAALSNLSINSSTIENFFPSIYTYDITVDYSTSQVIMGAAANDSNAQVSGSLGAINLSVGLNSLTITCTAEDGITTKNYSLNIIRETQDGIVFDSETNTIIDYNGDTASLNIPNEISGVPVTTLGFEAFRGSSFINLTIPNSVINIGPSAFRGCNNLSSVTIPENITTIEGYTFYGCGNLTEVILPEGLEHIDGNAFAHCNKLLNITFPNSLLDIGYCAFYSCDSLTDVVIPNNVSVVSEMAFSNCGNIESVTVSSGVIGINSFAYCTKLAYLTILNGVESLADDSFSCSIIESVDIPESVTYIGDAFDYCLYLAEINVSDTNLNYKSIDGVLFNKSASTLIKCPSAKAGDYEIPNTVSTLAEYAFYYCYNLTDIIIPNSVTQINVCAFYNCISLTSIILPSSISSIEFGLFEGCADLSSIVIPNSIVRIYDNAFQYCSSLESVSLPDSIKSIGDSFGYCENLTAITIPDSVTSIGNYAFRNCDNVIIFGTPGSYAETYANDNSIPFIDSSLSHEDCLSDLKIDNSTITGFLSLTYSYNIRVDIETESIEIGATPVHSNATLSGDIGTQSLSIGLNTFTITCTAEDGVTSQDYILNIKRSIPPADKVAILFGMADYLGTEKDLYGPVNDTLAMKAVLEKCGYTVYRFMNLTGEVMLDTVQIVASDMTPDSTLLLFYSGHGADGGYLVGTNFGLISLAALESRLSIHAGVKEVIIDACFSGDFIGKDSGSKTVESAKSYQDFNDDVISVFTKTPTRTESKSLAEGGYYVLTASSGSQFSYENAQTLGLSPFAMNTLVPYPGYTDVFVLGDFTTWFTDGLGLYDDPSFSTLWSDYNYDEIVTWRELYNYVDYFIGYNQSAQIYPENSNHILYQGAPLDDENLHTFNYFDSEELSLIYRVPDETPVSTFINTFSNPNSQIHVYSSIGDEVTSGYVGTGMAVTLEEDGTLIDINDICVFGDINSDGIIDIVDYAYIKMHIFEVMNLQDVQFVAGDIDINGIIDIVDYSYVKMDIYGVMSIN